MAPVIRPLEPVDIPALQRLDRAAHGEAWSHAAFIDQINERRHNHLVATDDADQPVAHAATWLDGSVLRVTNVACDPDAAGRGLATRLLVRLLADTDHDAPVTAVSLEVRPANRRAQRLYSRFGFAPAGIARNFYGRRDASGSCDALVMRVDDPDSTSWRRRLDGLRPDPADPIERPTPSSSPLPTGAQTEGASA